MFTMALDFLLFFYSFVIIFHKGYYNREYDAGCKRLGLFTNKTYGTVGVPLIKNNDH